jgi:hypothetical protein
MKHRSAWVFCCLFVTCTAVARSESGGYSDQELDPGYENVLLQNTFLMRAGGVDTLVLMDGTEVFVGVSQAPIKPDATPADVLKARRVAELKAMATVGQFLETNVSTVSELIKKTTVQDEGDLQGRVRRVEKFMKTHIETRSQLKARVKRVGSWRSADGKYQYVAMAVAPLN